MNPFYDAIKGFSDLPIALIAALFAALLTKKNQDHSKLFWMLSLTAVLGAVAHIFAFDGTVLHFIWVLLYLLLFECARRFSNLLSGYIRKETVAYGHTIFLCEGILYLTTLLFMFWLDQYDILVFVVFALICLIPVGVSIFKADSVPQKFVVAVILLIPTLLLQVFSARIPYAIVWEHLLITVDLFIVYRIAAE